MIVETSGWRHLKERKKLFLSYEYQKKYHPSPKTAQLSEIASNPKWKTLFLYYVIQTFFQLKITQFGLISCEY